MAKTKKRRQRRNVTVAIVFIKATFNNTTVTITDTKGDTLCWASAGTCGFKGSRKSTPFAGQCAAQQAAEKAIKFGVKDIDVRVSGSEREVHGRLHADPAQRLPTPKETKSLIFDFASDGAAQRSLLRFNSLFPSKYSPS